MEPRPALLVLMGLEMAWQLRSRAQSGKIAALRLPLWLFCMYGPLMDLAPPEESIEGVFTRKWTLFGLSWFAMGVLLALWPLALAWRRRARKIGWLVTFSVMQGVIIAIPWLCCLHFGAAFRPDNSPRDHAMVLDVLRRTEPLVEELQRSHAAHGAYPATTADWQGWEFQPQDPSGDRSELKLGLGIDWDSGLSLHFRPDGGANASYHGAHGDMDLRTWAPQK